ncbi:MAG: hypothetical protein LEGION0403_FIIPPAGN_00773 [Legionella sp.]|uniref:hypothetical protein n=1 Tax=Legionella sp. TaxID=459 RepID=UPI003D0B64FE
MVRKIFAVLMCFVSISAFACNNAVPTDNPGFCPSFKTAAICYCQASGLPAGMCQDMRMLYARLISVFGSLQKACEYQKYTSVQDCMDNWNCYRLGGADSRGRICSSTGKACS